MEIKKALVQTLPKLSEGSGIETPTHTPSVVPEGGIERTPVSKAIQLSSRRRAAGAGAMLQSKLMTGISDPPGADLLSFMGKGDFEKNLLGALGQLGIKATSINDPQVAQALAHIRESAGFATGEMDVDTMLSLLMTMAAQDRGSAFAPAPSSRQAAPTQGANATEQPQRLQLGQAQPLDATDWKAGDKDITAGQLTAIGRESGKPISEAKANEIAPHINVAMKEANVDTPKKKAAFLAQVIHKSEGFNVSEGKGNSAYDISAALGNTQKGDGELYKPRGYISIVGRNQYAAAGDALGLDLVNNPELASKPENAARIAGWVWNSRGLNAKAESGNFDDVTRAVNFSLKPKAELDKLNASGLKVLSGSYGAPSTGNIQNASAAQQVDPASTNTGSMTTAQKYDHYKTIIEQNGGKVDGRPGQRSLVGIRNENHRVNAYDDKMAVIWKDSAGNPQVKEFPANMESISRYQGRYGNDVNRDGRKDLATLAPGTYEYTKGRSSRFGTVLRPTTTTPVLRDTDRDGKGDALDRRGAGRSILFHKGGWRDTGSAGCQTMPPNHFNEFMRSLGSDTRVQYTVVDAS